MEVTLELVDILGDDALVDGVELASTTVVFEGAVAPSGDVLFVVHSELSWRRVRTGRAKQQRVE
jgi:hypothetical protein